jgi:hypothetical protein
MAFQDSSPELLTRLIVNKTIKNELCTCLTILEGIVNIIKDAVNRQKV